MNFLARNPEVRIKLRDRFAITACCDPRSYVIACQVMEAIRVEQMELLEKYGDRLTPEILEGTYTEATAVEVLSLARTPPSWR